MDIPKEVNDYIKESIDYSLGLPVSSTTLALKLQASEETQRRLRNQIVFLQSMLKEKDLVIERTRAESCMNAQSLKKFVEENQKLATECANLVNQCAKWEKECSLYYNDREALMDFGNEADERAKEAEMRVQELEDENKRLYEELHYYKVQSEQRAVNSSTECGMTETNLAAKVRMLEQDKEHLRFNLHRAEEEVKVLAEENSILNEENKRLLRQRHKDRNGGSGGKNSSSVSAKRSKRSTSPIVKSPVQKMADFDDMMDSARNPLSNMENQSLVS